MRNSNQTQHNLTRILIVVVATMLCRITATAQTAGTPQTQQISPTLQVQKPTASTPLARAASQRLIVVSIPDRKLVLVEDGVAKRSQYPVAVGEGLDAQSDRPLHHRCARQQSHLFSQRQSHCAGAEESCGIALDGAEYEGVRHSWNQ